MLLTSLQYMVLKVIIVQIVDEHFLLDLQEMTQLMQKEKEKYLPHSLKLH